jgi:hypothetical protein
MLRKRSVRFEQSGDLTMSGSNQRIGVINPNSSDAITRGLDAALEPLRFAGGPEILCSTLPDGRWSIETQADVESAVLPLRRRRGDGLCRHGAQSRAVGRSARHSGD